MNDPKRILIVRLSHLGDVACTLGLLHALHAAYPGAKIAWAIQPEFAPLVDPIVGLERTIIFERRGGLRAWLRVRRELRKFGPDLVVDAQGNLKSAAITWLAGAGRRVGMARSEWREKAGFPVLNDPAPASSNEIGSHLVRRIDGLIEHLVGRPSGDLERSAQVSLEELERGRKALSQGFGAGLKPLVVSLSMPGDVRSWPLERWSELLAALAAEGRPALISFGPREQQCALQLRVLRPELDGLRRYADPMDLRELTGLLAAGAECGSSFLGVDSGPMHLAWCSGMRVIVLEGPHDAARTGPWPVQAGRHRVVRAPEQPACAPCFKRRCNHPEGNVCMHGILSSHVLKELP